MTAHAKLSPSAAARWLTCTNAPSLEEKIPVKSSSYAEEGTAAHALAELTTSYNLNHIKKAEYKAKQKELEQSKYYDAEMQEAVDSYANYIWQLQVQYEDAEVWFEEKLDLTNYVPEGFGTADCVIVSEPMLHVIDFKYGKGVKVEAAYNPQMMLYALGALDLASSLYDIAEVEMTIVQPRLGGVSSWKISVDDLEAWAKDTVIPKAKAAYEGKGEFKPSEKACKFCRAADICKARADYFIQLFEDYDPDFLTPDELGALLKKADGMKSWLNSIEESVRSQLLDGNSVEGWKLVEGKSNRKYTDPEKVAERVREAGYRKKDIYEEKLIGITAMEKLLGKKKAAELIGDLIVKPKGNPTLADADDPRMPYDPADMFDEE